MLNPSVLIINRSRWLAILLVAGLSLSLTSTAYSAPREVTEGYLDWGLKASFRSYITGSIAKGQISVNGGASQRSGGIFRFPVAEGEHDSAREETTVSLRGSVHFTGHDGQLDMTFSDLRIELDGSSGTLYADIATKSLSSGSVVNYRDIALASLSTSDPEEKSDTFTWNSIGAAMTAAGVPAFGDFYTAGTALDSLTLSLEVEDAATATATVTRTATPTATITPTVTGSPAATQTPVTAPTSGTATPIATLPSSAPSVIPTARATTTASPIIPPTTGDAGLLR